MDDLTTLTLDVDGRVATVTLARPDQLNAMNSAMLRELVVVARWFDEQPEIRCVVFRGDGRAFSAGADLSLLAGAGDAADPRAQADLGRVMADAIDDMRAVTIAALHGWCIGGAVVLAAACDLRVASDGTRFAIPEVDAGIPLAWGGIPRLVREIGPAMTKELVLTCRPFDAAEARALGFLNRVVPAGDVDHEARLLADLIAAKPRAAVEPTVRHVDVVTAGMVGLADSWRDADALLAAFQDEEATAARKAYVRSPER